MKNTSNKLAGNMLIAMLAGIVTGLLFVALRESIGADSQAWITINNLLFQDITAEGAESALGIFYLGGQLFIRALQLIIVPMVFSSVVMAIGEIREASTLGRVSAKTIGWFLLTTFTALFFAGFISYALFKAGLFNISLAGISGTEGSTGSNPLQVILNIIPSNVGAVFSVNNSVLSIVFIAVVVGLGLNALDKGKDCAIYKLCTEISEIIVIFLNFVVNKFGPIAIFMLLSRTFATYGIDYLKPAIAYFILCVILFGFSTSSSAATLPLNLDTTTNELGVDHQIASFVLPLGMTINMDGTAIMQVVATLFIAGCGGYDVSVFQLFIIMILALIASMGTPAAPGAGAVILFTILSGVGFTGEQALIAYSLILANNRQNEMLVTSLNVTGDSLASIMVAKSENRFDADIYNK